MIRTIRQEEARQSLELTQAAFAVRFSDNDMQERIAKMNMEQFLGFYTDDRLAAQLAILPLRIYVQGEAFEMGGIAHVASYPELRRQGMVGKLLVRSLETMREKGQAVSMLNPFSYGFYRKYGWEYFSAHNVYTFEMSAVPKVSAVPSGVVKRSQAGDWKQADLVYDAYAKRYNGMLKRDENWWQRHVFNRKLGSMAIYYAPGDAGSGSLEPKGYMLYDIKDRFMSIHEFVYLDMDSRNGLWQFIGNHDSVASKLKFTAPADDPFLYALSEPKVQQEVFANFMVRIVDTAAFVKQYRFASKVGPVSLTVRLHDEHAPWNSGIWRIDVCEDGTGTAVKEETGAEGTDAAGCTIQTFSTMMIGCQRPVQLAAQGKLEGSMEAVAAWEQALPRRISFMTDFF
ncbi:GNAT family N-acetyltransferase [Paenibacillus silvisoli]|uniref:GNAT family N-acetyltransferase n=1 Tax=Paenibacillus silvisoli TaxID=3110539 RepID=UPI002804BD65|nr:GNAT family N-acetyltransferase [Paenibacillus silvisoli]